MRKSLTGIAVYLLGTAAAWVSVHPAFVIYLLTPWLFIVPVTRPGAARTGTAEGEP